MALYQPLKSDTKVLTPGQPVYFNDFVQLRGNQRGRTVIDRIIVRIFGTITVGTALWNGADVCRLLSGVTIDDVIGNARWQLSGYASRLKSLHLCGEDAVTEHGNVAVGAAQAIDLYLTIPMTKRFVVRGKDFGLPADMLRQVSLYCAPLASAQTGTTVLSAASLSATILCDWHEETNLEFKVVDQVLSQQFGSGAECRLALQGPMHDLLIAREAATAGGDTVSAITAVKIPDLGFPELARTELLAVHRYKRKLGNTNASTPGGEVRYNVAGLGYVLPVIAADEETSSFEGAMVNSVLVQATGVPANSMCIYRQILPRNPTAMAAQFAQFGIDAKTAGMLRVKTESKSKQHPMQWTKQQAKFLPMSLPLERLP